MKLPACKSDKNAMRNPCNPRERGASGNSSGVNTSARWMRMCSQRPIGSMSIARLTAAVVHDTSRRMCVRRPVSNPTGIGTRRPAVTISGIASFTTATPAAARGDG